MFLILGKGDNPNTNLLAKFMNNILRKFNLIIFGFLQNRKQVFDYETYKKVHLRFLNFKKAYELAPNKEITFIDHTCIKEFITRIGT